MEIAELYENTELTIQQIADKIGSTYKKVSTSIKRKYSLEVRNSRKKICYSNSKKGLNNPYFGKRKEETTRYIGKPISDHKGYLVVLKPEWYTGRKNSKHVYQHHVVWCEHHNKTEIPAKWVIHHCDRNGSNNAIENLICLHMSDHTRLHSWLGRVTTISKESTIKWLEAHSREWFL